MSSADQPGCCAAVRSSCRRWRSSEAKMRPRHLKPAAGVVSPYGSDHRGRRVDGLPVLGWLLHAHAESVLQLVERGQAAFVEGHIPQAAQRAHGLRVISAQQSCRLLHCLCLVLPTHCHLPFARFQGCNSPWGAVHPRPDRAGAERAPHNTMLLQLRDWRVGPNGHNARDFLPRRSAAVPGEHLLPGAHPASGSHQLLQDVAATADTALYHGGSLWACQAGEGRLTWARSEDADAAW